MATLFDFLNAVAALEKPDGVIAFPTDTVYGLGCLPWKLQAIEKIYRLKGRSGEKPLILMSHSLEALQPFIGEMTLVQANRFQALANAHWPGPLTLVVPKSDKVPPEVTRNLETVGLRIPDYPFLLEFFKMIPKDVLATTSANLSDQPECRTASDVFEIFGSQIDFLLMDDRQGSGEPSTVAAIDKNGRVDILRPGSIVLD